MNEGVSEGLRHEMEEDGKLVQFIFRGVEIVTEEKGNNIIRFIRGYELIASDAESARTYYHYASDEMGSIIHLVEGNEVLNHYEYDAWGNTTVCEETVENRFQFNGQQYDAITQQYYLRARFYNPVIARFTQEDTYRGAGLNLYDYCANNPIYYVDISGHQPKCVKEAAQKYMDEGMSKEDAYKKAYQEHAERKLADKNLSAKERSQLEHRSDRLNGNDAVNNSKKRSDDSELLNSNTEYSNATTNADFIVTLEGVILPTNEDLNLVSTNVPTDKGGEFLQIHFSHNHGKLTNPHTHLPIVNVDPTTGKGSINRETRETETTDINNADKALRDGTMRVRSGRKDKGGY